MASSRLPRFVSHGRQTGGALTADWVITRCITRLCKLAVIAVPVPVAARPVAQVLGVCAERFEGQAELDELGGLQQPTTAKENVAQKPRRSRNYLQASTRQDIAEASQLKLFIDPSSQVIDE